MQIRTFALGPLQTNCYLLSRNGEAVVVDPGGDPAAVLGALENDGLTLTHILNTHFHFDHVGGNRKLAQETGAPILASSEDAYLMETELGLGGFMGLPRIEMFEYENIKPGAHRFLGLECTVFRTPGHSPGSLSFYFPDAAAVFVGDLVFYRSVGRTDFPGGDFDTLKHSVMESIFTLPDETAIYTGHGEATNVGDEKRNNPFFSDFHL
ncbi:MBL fold metallo-hydrolase [Oceanidesulfovibrio indonesiensis]|uniref:MBL fold metallo-hydrolase n=1 Tax=Oceanidesulfovibrio indonesiensis TaxID=54767 RepID=A0A7M3MF65_9BACT|nr:MBL fold metallo-hydrolase [Oceanidesulfovibrio indonesiensis]TVM17202.1 MBL fold metallo-hydrolase [Oceanidesulfovibrio indonesiensis]